ncbi:MAG: ribokinase [Clostridiaceae bacterium]|nr:ribokinase [Clostridiaceae bacterium]
MRVLNFGSLNIDYVYTVSHIVQPGETLSADGRAAYFGGKGLNQSIAIAKAGVPVFHAGKVGADGGGLLSECRKYGVDATYIETSDGETGHTVIQVDRSGQNSIVLFGGSNRAITHAQIGRVLSQFSAGDFLVLQNEISGLPYLMQQAAARGLQIILNPSPCDGALLSCDLSAVRWLVLNEIEGEQLTGEQESGGILRALAGRYPEMGVVLTLGGDGAFCQSGGKRIFQPSCKVTPVDTTAAGDTFLGYFTAGLYEGLPLPRVMERASAAAALAITRKGAAPSIPTKEEVTRYLKEAT